MLVRGLVMLALMCTVGCDAGKGKPPKEKDKKEKKAKGSSSNDQSNKPKTDGALVDLPDAESYLVDTGFRPARDGFPFENGERGKSYPQSSKGFLDSIGLQKLYGAKKVCISGVGDSCKLKPAAQQFAHQVNESMNGGQCEGLAVLGLSLHTGLDKPNSFAGAATKAFDLDREAVRSPTGYYFAFQMIDPVASYKYQKRQRSTPAQELDFIIDQLKKKDDPVVVGIRVPRGGHAVAAYAVEDRGNNVFWVRVWDNNAPGVSRAIEIDKNANTWKYNFGATNPAIPAEPWEGVAAPNTIYASPLNLRMGEASCDFCGDNTDQRMVMVTGDAKALLKDDSGNSIGFADGALVNTVPGGKIIEVDAYVPGMPPPNPVFLVPSRSGYNIELSGGKGPEDVAVGVYSATTALVVDKLDIGDGQKDSLSLQADGINFTYNPSAARKPEVSLAIDSSDKDFLVDMSQLDGSKPMSFNIDSTTLRLDVKEDGEAADFDFTITRFNAQGDAKVFKKADVPEGRGLTGDGGIALGDLE